MFLSFLLLIIELIYFKVQSASIVTVDPISFKINEEKLGNISMTLILDEVIQERDNAKITLSNPNNERTISAQSQQDGSNLKNLNLQ